MIDFMICIEAGTEDVYGINIYIVSGWQVSNWWYKGTECDVAYNCKIVFYLIRIVSVEPVPKIVA